MKPIIFFLLYFSLICPTYSQIEISLIPNKLNIKSVHVNKPDKMTLYGVSKDKIESVKTNLYYYNSTQGNGQSIVYLDKNNIDLFLNEDSLIFIIYDAGFKKKLTSARNCYYSIEIDNKGKKANLIDLLEEDKLSFTAPKLLSIYNQNGVDKHINYSSEIQLCFNPPIYFFKTYYTYPRTDINSSKYGFNIELVFTETFLDLYKILSFDIKTMTLNNACLQLINESLQDEISKISSLAPKGEFETTEIYNSRINEGQQQKLEIEVKYQKLTSEFKSLSENDLLLKVKYSLQQVILKIDNIGNYDADNQIFPITINGITKNIEIAIDQAENFKIKKDEIKVFADKKLEDNGETFKIFNIIIKNPISGEDIYF